MEVWKTLTYVRQTAIVLTAIHYGITAESFIALLSIPLPAQLLCYQLCAINFSFSVLGPS